LYFGVNCRSLAPEHEDFLVRAEQSPIQLLHAWRDAGGKIPGITIEPSNQRTYLNALAARVANRHAGEEVNDWHYDFPKPAL
jgi:hypothetical protein